MGLLSAALCLTAYWAQFSVWASPVDEQVKIVGHKIPSPTCSKISPQPTGLYCGARGHITPPKSFVFHTYPQRAINEKECRNLCLSRVSTYFECVSFEYNTATGHCAQYHSSIANSKPVLDEQSNTTFSDASCYNCTNSCALSDKGNFLYNGGWEEGGLGPWEFNPSTRDNYDYNTTELVSPGYKSATTFRCSGATAKHNFQCTLSQTRELCLNHLYIYRAKVKRGAGTVQPISDQMNRTFAELRVDNTEFPAILTRFIGVEETDSWVTMELFFNQTKFRSFTNPIIDWTLNTNGFNLFLDDLEIVAAPTHLITKGESLIPNGGFESGHLEPWIIGSHISYEIVSPGLTGSNFAFQFSPNGSNQLFHGFRLSHRGIRTVPGRRYIVSLNYLLINPRPRDSDFACDLVLHKDNNELGGDVPGFYTTYRLPNSRDTLRYHQALFTAVTDYMTVSLDAVIVTANTTVVFDNIEMYELA